MDKSPKIILTTDETMMSRYRGGMFIGFSTCMPQGILPDWLYFRVFAPPVPRKDGRAVYADFGLRIVEASLLENGFSREEVAVVHPRDLEKMMGDETEIVAIGGHDHLGINPPTSEFVDLTRSGPPYNRVKFLELVRKLILKDVKVVVGGKSAWQLADLKTMNKLGIDYVHLGEGELSVPRAFKAILQREKVPRIITGEDTPVEKIPNLRGGVIHGLVEISRGCGRGCKFCTPGMQRLRHKPIDHILRDVKVILESGCAGPLLHNEDVLRYGTYEIRPNKEKVIELFQRVANLKGVNCMGTSHVALATVYHDPDLVEAISEIFMSLPRQRRIGTQTGIETGSPRLIEKHMHGKALPSPPEKWPEIVKQSLGILEDNHWIPACTLISGLPGEKKDDVVKTLDLLDDIKDSLSLIVPLAFVSMKGSTLSAEESFTVKKMLPEHWMVLGKCMEHDAWVARKLKKDYAKGNNILIRWLFDHLSEYLIKSSEKYAGKMKGGEPPRDYSKTSKNYLVPEF
ncbi:MAG: radical SAM protein [Candidatus Hadarchaeota archaeon]|nr:radical SAM protein [Candidatus Hadarchaeota archaeon]